MSNQSLFIIEDERVVRVLGRLYTEADRPLPKLALAFEYSVRSGGAHA